MRGSISRRWNWLDTVLLPLAGALMRAAWIAPPLNAVLRFITADDSVGGAGVLAFALLLGGSATAALARRAERGRWIAAGVGLLGVIAAEWWLVESRLFQVWDVRWLADLTAQWSGEPGAILALAVLGAATALWWRGMTAQWSSHDELARSFVLGVVVLFVSLLLLPRRSPHSAAELAGAAALFLASAWAGLSLAEVSAASGEARRQSATIRLNRYWLLAVLAVVLGIFGLGLMATSLVSPATVAGLLAAVQPVWSAIGQVVLLVFVLLSYALFLVLSPLFWLLRRLGGDNTAEPLQPPQFTRPTPTTPTETALWPPALLWLLRIGAVLGLLALVGLLFAWALRRYYSRDEEGIQESRELMWSWDLIRGQLSGLLGRLRPEKVPALFGPLPASASDLRAAVRIAYRQVLQLAAEHGQPRQPGQTPAGYLPTLLTIWPGEAEALGRLTDLYTEARYNPAAPTAEQAAQAQASVEHIVNLPPAKREATSKNGRP